MLGNIVFQILMFVIIWDIYLRIGGQNTNLKNRVLYLLFDVALCIWGQLIGRYLGVVPPLVSIVTLTFSYQLNKTVTSVERFFLGFYPVVLVDLARRFLATFFFPPIIGVAASTLNNNIWWSMVPLSFVVLTVRIVDFILRLDFTDILKVATQQEKKNRLGLVNMLLLIYYLVIFLVSTFDSYFPELHLESNLRLPLVMGYLYLLLFVLGAVNQFAKEKIEQDLTMKQANYLDDLKRENARVEGLYRDLMFVRSNYNYLLNNLRDIERTGDIRSYKKDLVDLYVNRDQYSFSTQVTDLENIQNPSIHSLLSSKYHEAQMYRLNIHAEIPDPVVHSYLTDLDLAVILGHLMDNAIAGARKVNDGFISLAYFDEEDCQSFIVESAISDEQAPLSMMTSQNLNSGGIGVNAVQDILERYPNTSLSVRSQNHKMMQILEMRP
ncbi:GHKL domain-containing protein [Streptococcus raffinosi]|uniref:GHKL domain-containing protein n=1 Tax=Streptococcus raffinosi TaxID=3053355 RepID=A0ABT7LTQ9_9STRE|nr:MULTISPECIES: GHKL domain-containing protein [unclassified Streptococcus]MDL5043996.1 GHKL domain-containing protein [Streptococcus sp. VTCC 12812]MDM0095229.1 GHKL domain-containing protein [Streptococcus sp. VTCC 12813]